MIEINSPSASMQHLSWNPGAELVGDAPNLEASILPQKQELLYEAARDCEGSPENLGSWTRKDVLQFLCLEMGKGRKYTGVSKSKMVDHFLRLVSVSKPGEEELRSAALLQPSPFASQSPVRRQRKGCRPSRLPSTNEVSALVDEKELDPYSPHTYSICRNSACRAQLPQEVSFCKRCSCCICKQFDDNKDPSLWIGCTSESFGGRDGCGLSCHLECALKQGIAGVVSSGRSIKLDGSYCCESCGRVSGLIGCWKKQLLIAKDARRVDILCQRLFLSHKLLDGTCLYKEIHEIVDSAIKRLQAEVGSIAEGSAKLARCIVNRLSSGAEVQRLIGLALEKAETLNVDAQARVKDSNIPNTLEECKEALCTMHFEDVSSSSILVTVDGGKTGSGQELLGYKLWHRKASESSYPDTPTCIISGISKKALFPNLQACTEYAFKIVPFSGDGDERQSEVRCFTKSIEVMQWPFELQPPLELTPLEVAFTVGTPEGVSNRVNEGNEDVYNSDEDMTGFKVRDLAKVLHKANGQEEHSLDVNEGIFQSKARPRMPKKNSEVDENEGEYVSPASPASNVLLNPGADVSSIPTGGLKPMQVANHSTSDVHENPNPGPRWGQIVVEAGLEYTDTGKASQLKDSGLLMLENPAVQLLGDGTAKVTVLDEASHPCSSQAAREEETVIISLDASGCLQENGITGLNQTMEKPLTTDDLEANRHGQSWAVQVRSKEKATGMQPPRGIVRKRTVENLERAQDQINGCMPTIAKADCAASSYEFSVKVIRWLECEGHIKENFRMKFLTWYSLRATDHEKRVVSVFIDTLQDDPASLAGQLVDTFTDLISTKRQQTTPDGFCKRLCQ